MLDDMMEKRCDLEKKAETMNDAPSASYDGPSDDAPSGTARTGWRRAHQFLAEVGDSG